MTKPALLTSGAAAKSEMTARRVTFPDIVAERAICASPATATRMIAAAFYLLRFYFLPFLWRLQIFSIAFLLMGKAARGHVARALEEVSAWLVIWIVELLVCKLALFDIALAFQPEFADASVFP